MIVVGAFAIVFLPGFLEIQQLRERRQELRKEIERLDKENAQLKQETTLLKEDPLTIERAARKKLGVAREGEVLYRFNSEDPSQ